MTNKLISILAIVVLAICLMSGGCSSTEENRNLKAWKDLIKLVPEEKAGGTKETKTSEALPKTEAISEKIEIELYFTGADYKELVAENRKIEKAEGIARSTVEELIKGPAVPEHVAVFPEGTRLLDINLKPDGTCILDFSVEVQKVENSDQEKMLVDSVSSTLAQFPTMKRAVFMIEGENIRTIKGAVDLSSPLEINPAR